LTEQWEPLSLAHILHIHRHTHTHTHTQTLVCDCLWRGRNRLWMPGRVCVFRMGWCALLCSYHGKVALSRPHQNNTACFVCWAWHSYPLPQIPSCMVKELPLGQGEVSKQLHTHTHTHTERDRWLVIHREFSCAIAFLLFRLH